MRRLLALFGVLGVSLAMLLAGPNAPGAAASVIDLTKPVPVNVPGSGLGSIGATGATITDAARTASSTGAGTNIAVKMGGVAAAGGAAGAATTAGGAAVAVAGAAYVGWEIGTFAGTAACAGGVDLLCWPKDPEWVPDADLPPDTAGFVPSNSFPVVGAAPGPTVGPETTVAVGTPTTPYLASPGSGTVQAVFAVVQPSSTPSGSTAYYRIWFGTHCRLSSGAVDSVLGANGSAGAYAKDGLSNVANVNYGCASTKKLDFLEFRATDYATGSPTGPSYYWYPETHPDRPEVILAAQRHWLTRGQCVKPVTVGGVEGVETVWVEAISATFSEGDPEWPKYPDVSCDGGQLKRLEVHKITPSFDPDGDDIVWEWDYPTDGSGLTTAEKYPECAAGACLLKLWRIVDGVEMDCFAHESLCAGWWSLRTADPAVYQCRYGANAVALSECYIYRPTFEPEATLETAVEGEIPEPAYANPDGSLDSGEPTDPNPPPRNCPPDAGFLSFLNPFWLFDTLKCAFIPTSAGLQAGWDNADVDWCSTAAGVLTCSVETVMGPFLQLGVGVDPEDCLGAEIQFPEAGMLKEMGTDGGSFYPFQACEPPATTLSEFWLGISSGIVYLGAFLTGGQMLARTIGAQDSVPA